VSVSWCRSLICAAGRPDISVNIRSNCSELTLIHVSSMHTHTTDWLAVWHSGNIICRINKVTILHTQLVLGQMTVFVYVVPSAGGRSFSCLRSSSTSNVIVCRHLNSFRPALSVSFLHRQHQQTVTYFSKLRADNMVLTIKKHYLAVMTSTTSQIKARSRFDLACRRSSTLYIVCVISFSAFTIAVGVTATTSNLQLMLHYQ